MPGAVANPKKGRKGPEQDDAFLRALDRLVSWVRSNTVAVVAATIALVLLVGFGFWYRSYQQSLEDRAGRRLESLRAEITAGQQTDPAAALQSFLDSFGGTAAAREARLVLARQLLQADQASRALSTVRPTVDATSPDTPTGYAARRLQADALEASGDVEGALEVLQELSEKARFAFQRHQTAAQRARLLRQEGRLEEALAIYERLAAEAEESGAVSLYAERAGEIRGLLASSSVSSGGEGEAAGSAAPGTSEAGGRDTTGG